MTLRQLSSTLVTALLWSTVFFAASEARGQQDQTTGGLDIPTKKVVAWVPNTTDPEGDANTLPDAPSAASQQDGQVSPAPSVAKQSGTVNASETGKQTKRILYIVPNFRAVSADQVLPPQTVKEKFKTATLDSVDYSSFIFVAVQSGIAEARNANPEFRQGAAGYGRYYWHTYADYADRIFGLNLFCPQLCIRTPVTTRWAEAAFPSGSHIPSHASPSRELTAAMKLSTPPRYSGQAPQRASQAYYYPSTERTFTKTYQRWITSLAIDGGTFVFKEFWPNINRKFFHQK